MPFARSPEAEAERWLRILRLHGEAGTALQALGVSEGPLEAHGAAAPSGERGNRGAGMMATSVAAVTEDAVQVARQRGARRSARATCSWP